VVARIAGLLTDGHIMTAVSCWLEPVQPVTATRRFRRLAAPAGPGLSAAWQKRSIEVYIFVRLCSRPAERLRSGECWSGGEMFHQTNRVRLSRAPEWVRGC